ncbi:C40 family peptidase [Schleiferilactobacillus shenzhenensis]|uniref:Chitinase n=1 Tax=Schleiferilactobacillus shenzhenensis LY-73 TaxID=1231336 RepID=U4TTE7_9LACO|nr:C40 family peptidase [Schleiferilactobacillus shenzhenensis]ERL64727.1 chitinase [Schleiferilactobacillus shenzhenensis LY-73]
MKTSKQVLRVLSILALSGTLATSVAGVAQADNISDTKDKISSNKSTTSALLTKIQDQQKTLAKLNNDVSEKMNDISANEKAIAAVTKDIAAFDGKISAAQKQVTDRIDVLKKQLVALQKQSSNSISGNVYVDFVLNSKDFSDLISRSMTVNKLSVANKDALDAVNAAKTKLATLRQDKADTKASLETKQTALVQQKSQLETLKDNAQKQQDAFNKELEEHKGELAALQAQLSQQTADATKKAQEAAAKAAAEAAAQQAASQVSAQSASSSTSASSSSSASTSSSATVSGTNKGSLIANVQQYLGVPYVWGGTTPAGFDCSGLIYYAAKQAGISLPRVSQAQSTVGSYVAVSDLQAGDLVFWGGVGSAYHVGIYIGNGQYIHAPAPGQNVTVGNVSYFKPDFGRRI